MDGLRCPSHTTQHTNSRMGFYERPLRKINRFAIRCVRIFENNFANDEKTYKDNNNLFKVAHYTMNVGRRAASSEFQPVSQPDCIWNSRHPFNARRCHGIISTRHEICRSEKSASVVAQHQDTGYKSIINTNGKPFQRFQKFVFVFL